MAENALDCRKQPSSTVNQKDLEILSTKKHPILAKETLNHSSSDKKQDSLTRDSGLISANKKSNFLMVEGELSFPDKKLNPAGMEIGQKSSDKQTSANVETTQLQAENSCNTKKRSSVTIETVTYEVQDNDTLTSIGARFDMAPSELKQLNKLMSSQIYTKQKLQIYTKNFLEAEEREKAQRMALEENLRNSGNFDAPRSRHSSAAACDLSRIRHHSGRKDDLGECVTEKSVDRIVSDIKKNRLRLEAKHVTDGQGVVSGTLLVTTNTIMFDPNVSDRLVIDRGRNPYVMVAPFENVVRLAIVDDIAAMKWQRTSNMPPPTVYCGDQGCGCASKTSSSGEIVSSSDSADKDSVNKSESPIRSNDFPQFSAEIAVNNQHGNGKLIVSGGEKMTDRKSSEQFVPEPVSPQSNGTYDCSADTINSSDDLFMKNCVNLQGRTLEQLSRPGLFSQRRRNTAYEVFPISIDNQPANGDAFLSSSFPATVEFSTAGCNPEPAVVIGSPLDQPVSGISCTYDRKGKGFPRRQSLASVTDYKDSLLRRQSFSTVVDGGLTTPSKLVPVYSAKCIPRLGSTLQSVESFGSFCIPPGQSYIVDLAWDQFGGMKVDDGFCLNIYDLPPIVDEDVQLMEKPDFFISDDEDAEVLPEKTCAESENINKKSSEVDVVKLLKSTDELYRSLDVLIPRPAVHYEDLPMYLCVVIGCPLPNRNSKGLISPDSYSVESMKPQFWFSIHRCDVHPLYEFIMNHFSNIYGSEDEINPADRGLMVLSQVVIKSEQEASVCQFFFEEEEDSPCLPSFSEESHILEASQIAKLNCELFPRGKDCYWKLAYSIERDGISLQTLYRKMTEFLEQDPPCILLIRDSSRTVFGVALTCAVKRSREYYGNGESFLFSFKDGFKKYSAPCVNDYYAYGYKDSLCFGASRGKCGLWIDGDLHHGRTQECATYGNDILTMTEDFYIHQFEAWCLV